VLERTAALIDRLARRIEDAVRLAGDQEDVDAAAPTPVAA
jgi:hypothetical protein